jgi:hypothetical protein
MEIDEDYKEYIQRREKHTTLHYDDNGSLIKTINRK